MNSEVKEGTGCNFRYYSVTATGRLRKIMEIPINVADPMVKT
jgi:hypothetical protein